MLTIENKTIHYQLVDTNKSLSSIVGAYEKKIFFSAKTGSIKNEIKNKVKLPKS